MGRFCTLFSGSDGNSVYLSGGNTALLVDAGKSCRQILLALESRGLARESIVGLCVTHEHTDHISALPVLLKRLSVPVYATEAVLSYLAYRGHLPPGAKTVTVTPERPFALGDIEGRAFCTSHDSVGSVGYRFTLPGGVSVGIATDMGVVEEPVRRGLEGCHLVMVESNYDPGMLSASDYTYALKRRIASPVGHLANGDCARELPELVKRGVSHFVLGHLSNNTNMPHLAKITAMGELMNQEMREDRDYRLYVAPRNEAGEVICF